MKTKHDFRGSAASVLNEINKTISQISGDEVEKLIKELSRPGNVFVAGTGRSLLMMQAFAKRLKHLGIDVRVAGEITAGPITKRDIMIAGSGSGETGGTVNAARIAKKNGARLAVITAEPSSALSKIADIRIIIPALTAKNRKIKSFQPLGSLFEQTLLILTDVICAMLKKRFGISSSSMLKRHANLE